MNEDMNKEIHSSFPQSSLTMDNKGHPSQPLRSSLRGSRAASSSCESRTVTRFVGTAGPHLLCWWLNIQFHKFSHLRPLWRGGRTLSAMTHVICEDCVSRPADEQSGFRHEECLLLQISIQMQTSVLQTCASLANSYLEVPRKVKMTERVKVGNEFRHLFQYRKVYSE